MYVHRVQLWSEFPCQIDKGGDTVKAVGTFSKHTAISQCYRRNCKTGSPFFKRNLHELPNATERQYFTKLSQISFDKR